MVADASGRRVRRPLRWYGGDAVNVLVLPHWPPWRPPSAQQACHARDSMPEAAASAGWSLDRIAPDEAILNLAFIVGPAIRLDDRDGWRHHHNVGLPRRHSGCPSAIAALQLEGVGRPHLAAPRVGIRIAEGLRFNLRVLRTPMIDLTVTALYLPMEYALFPKYYRPPATGAAGLGALRRSPAAAWRERWGMPLGCVPRS